MKPANQANWPPSWRIWGMIRSLQVTYGITDEKLAEYMQITMKTLRSYDEDQSKLTLAKLDRLREAIGPMIDLL